MYCQPPLQSWGTFSLEKKGLIFLQRSTGRFSRGVSALLGRGGRAGRRAKCFGDREARSQGACGGFISAATLPPCPRRDACARAWGQGRPRGSLRVASERRRVRGRGGRSARVPSARVPSCSVARLCPLNAACLSFLPAPKEGGEKSENRVLASLLPSCAPDGPGRHLRDGQAKSFPSFSVSTPRSGAFFRVLFISENCNTQSMLLR